MTKVGNLGAEFREVDEKNKYFSIIEGKKKNTWKSKDSNENPIRDTQN